MVKPALPGKARFLVNWVVVVVVAFGAGFLLLNQIGKLGNNNLRQEVSIAHAQTTATLALSPTSGTFALDQTFTVNINLNTGGNPADGVDIYSLHFNPSILQVQDSVSGTTGVQIAPGTTLPNTVINTVDNTAGTVQFSQSTSGGSSFTGSGTLATITFKAIASGTSAVTMDFTPGSTSDTNVGYQGTDKLSSVTNASFKVDTTKPTVSISAPAGGASVNGTITVSATASDNVGVAGVQFKLDGSNLSSEDTSSPYSISWNTTGVSNGSHNLTAVARDTVDNTKTSTAVSVTVNNTVSDTTPPTVSITAPSAGTVSGTITVSANASDNVGVAGVQFKLDGSNLSSEDTSSPYSISWNTTTASEGAHSLTATARDAAGNTKTSNAVSVTTSNNTLPNGNLDSIDVSGNVLGWSFDPDTSSSSNQVQIFINGARGTGTLIGTITASTNRPDIRTFYGITGNHGFSFSIPQTYRDGQYHSIYAYGVDMQDGTKLVLLPGSPQNFTSKTIIVDPEGLSSKAVSGTLQILNSSKSSTLANADFTTDSAGNSALVLQVPSQTVYFKLAVAPFLAKLVSVNLGLSSSSVTIPQLQTGDINQDNIINSVDYSILNTHWFTAYSTADLNADGLVNSIDYSFMNKHWLVSGDK
ncbi:MAG TPA: Ig-like domain-containing protein [Patescibacteria group bacterium]|nr:Ig-like domain-containing protein [Patescibacteria group bacterium]